jgi:hypothetical protein
VSDSPMAIHSRVPAQTGLMRAWRNEFMCIEMDIAARFNICIQPHCRVGRSIIG